MTSRAIRPLFCRAALLAAAFLSLNAAVPENTATAFSSDTSSSPAVLRGADAGSAEGRIQRLHDRLKVTPEQEFLWSEVARVMRANASRMAALIVKIKSEPAKSKNAVDDMKAYGEIAAAHADSIQSLIPVFEAFYASLSDDQKRIVESEDIKF